jgi:hypothetical protein
MTSRQRQLAERRAMLVARAAAQRVELAQAVLSLRRPLEFFDYGIRALRNFAHHPHLLLGMAVAIVVVRPWRMLGTIQRGWSLWRAALALKSRFFG